MTKHKSCLGINNMYSWYWNIVSQFCHTLTKIYGDNKSCNDDNIILDHIPHIVCKNINI